MKLVRGWVTQELTYQYDNNMQKELHQNSMISRGFTIIPEQRLPFFMQRELTVTYEKRKRNYNIARL